MDTINKAQKSIDELVIFRARTLLFAALSLGLWQFGWLAMDMVEDSSVLFQSMGWMSVIGAVLWVIAIFLILKFNREMKRANSCSALHDELTVKNRNISFFNSYIILFGLIWVLIPLLDHFKLDAYFAMRLIAIVAIILPMVFFSVAELSIDEATE